MTAFYRFLYRIAPGLLRFFYRVKLVGKPDVPDGPYIVCANHISAIDVLFLAIGVKRQIFFFAKAEAFSLPLLGKAVKALGAVPVRRGEADVGAIKSAVSILKEDKLLGLFPQGTRMPGKAPLADEAKSGVGLIAYRGHAGIIPAHIETKNYRIRLFRKVTVTFGQPIPYDDLGFIEGNMAEFQAVSHRIFSEICELPEKTKAEEKV